MTPTPEGLTLLLRADLEKLVQEHVERLLSKHSYGQHDDDERIWLLDREDLTTWMGELALAAYLVSCVNQMQETEKELATRVDEQTVMPPERATAASNEAVPTGCVCPLDGSTCWDCGGNTEPCATQKEIIEEIRLQAFIQAGIDIGFCYSTDDAMSNVLSEARKHGAELAALEAPQAVVAVDPVDRVSSARPRATDSSSSSPPVITPGPREGQDIEPVDVVGLFTLGGPVTTATTREVLIAAVLDRLAASPISEVAITSQGTKPYDPLQDTHPGCSQHPSDVRTMCCLGCVAKEISTARRRAATAEKENKQLKSVLVGLVERANTVLTNPDPPSSQEV